MFEVSAVRGWLPSKLVELTSLEEMTGVKMLEDGIRGKIYRCPYDFPKGAKFILEFAPWRRFKVGDHVDVSTILQHPSVQRQLFRNWESRL